MSKQKRSKSKKSGASIVPPAVEATAEGQVVEAKAAEKPDEQAVEAKAEKPAVEAKADEKPAVEAKSDAEPERETTAEPPAVTAKPGSVAPKAKKPRKKKGESMRPPAVSKSDASELKVAPAVLDKKLDALEQKLEEKIDAHQAARKGMATDPDDESSIPPVVEHEHEEQFFADAEKKPAPAAMSGGFEAVDPMAHKMTPAAHARRAHLSKYVKAAVAGAAAICLIAFVRMKLTPAESPTVAHSNAVVQPVPEVKTPDPTPQPSVATPAPVVDQAPAQDLSGDAKAPELSVDSAKDAGAVETPSSPVGVVGDGTAKPKTAWQEKATAKAALESGNNATAISAGERSVALDGSDGETWLVLGAAYQASGNNVQAKRCFNACISQGKKGPIDECKSMLAQ